MKEAFKRIMEKIGTTTMVVIFLAIPILFGLSVITGIAVKFVQIVGRGSVWLGIITIPFFVFGIIQMLRGFAEISNRDFKKLLGDDSIWHSIGSLLYFPASLFGYAAVFWSILCFFTTR